METLATRLKKKDLKGLAETNLKLFRQFYSTYPQIRQTLSDELKPVDLQLIKIGQAPPSDQFSPQQETKSNISLLINSLSFSHFIELLKADSELKRRFYETQAVRNNWGVRDLKRAIESLLYERTGLSTNKQITLKKHIVQNEYVPQLL